MEKIEVKAVFESIKKDDVKSFSSIMLSNSDLNLCYGRFPILSLCYLYGSYKILEKYEKLLFAVKNFNVVEEYYEIYLKFKKYAKKCLKLYVLKDKIVYPVEMLAILDERFLIVKNYKFLFKNEEIIKNIHKIYKVNKKINIFIDFNEIKIEKKKLSLRELFIAGVSSFLLILISLFSVFSYVFVKDKFGIGTAKNPIKISTELQLQTAIKNGSKYYSIQNDITLTKEWTATIFKGTILGNGHKLIAGEHLVDGFVVKLSGKIDNLHIQASLNNKNISDNFGLIAKESTGKISNCSVTGEFSFQAYNDTDVYICLFASTNNGEIKNCTASATTHLNNNRSANAFFSTFVGNNSGVIENCKTETGKITGDTVDISGIVSSNAGTINNVTNNFKISQTSSKEWHPNTAGVCLNNTGTIENSKNFGEISAESTRSEKIEDSDVAVICGGVVCDNSGFVKNCRNTGKITAKGDIALIYAGGISARNILETTYPKIEKSKAECDIEVFSKTNIIYVGGVSGYNASEVINCGFVGTIDAVTNSTSPDITACVGGVVGYNRECRLENSYSKVVYLNRDNTKKFQLFGGIVGFVGAISYISLDGFSYTPHGLSAVLNNHFVIDASFSKPAFGAQSQVLFESIVSSVNNIEISADSEIFIAHAKLEDISQEVLIND